MTDGSLKLTTTTIFRQHARAGGHRTVNLKTQLLTVLAGALTSCISINPGGVRREADYVFPSPSKDWRPTSGSFKDGPFRSPHTGSVLGLSTACDGSADASFEDLLKTMTAALPGRTRPDEIETLSDTPIPARIAKARGVIDATPIEMMAIVLRSQYCVYDVTLTGRTLTQKDSQEAVRLARSLRLAGTL